MFKIALILWVKKKHVSEEVIGLKQGYRNIEYKDIGLVIGHARLRSLSSVTISNS